MRVSSKKLLVALSLSTAALALSTTASNAAGFYIQEQSVSGLGSAFAGSVTNLNDPSTIYFNPAGMTKLMGTQVQGAAHILIPNSELTDTGSTNPTGGAISGGDGGNPYDPTPVPNGFISYQVNDQVWAGLGITAPFGLANEYDSDWFGRFDSIKTDLKVIDIQPTLAFKVNDYVSVGIGFNAQFADAELTSASGGPGAGILAGVSEGVSTLEGDDWSYGYNLGVTIKPLETTTIGLSYRSAVSHELEGTVSATGTTLADFDVAGHADLDLPDIAMFGVSHDLNEKWTLMGQATWFGWNNFQDITAVADEGFSTTLGVSRAAGDVVSSVTQNYQTTWAFAVGAEYAYSDELTLRGGMQFDETPTTDQYRTSRTPDGDRTWLSGGATYSISDKLNLDLAATYIFIDDEEISVQRNNSFSSNLETDVNADTEGNVGIVSVGFTYKF